MTNLNVKLSIKFNDYWTTPKGSSPIKSMRIQ